MLNNRAKAGGPPVDWLSLALGKKYQRKTIGLGAFDENKKKYEHQVHIRELCIATGALGCAIWDGGVILARFIFENRHMFANQTVLELGSGCALPGIVAARVATHVSMTDYVNQVIDNIKYNIDLNSNLDEDEDSDEDEPNPWPPDMRRDIKQHTTAGFLDWDAIEKPPPAHQCTRLQHKSAFVVQEWSHCVDCHKDEGEGCCQPCAIACHEGHNVQKMEASKFRCDCFDEETCKANIPGNLQTAPVDIIIGAELTYNLLSIDTLIKVIQHYLKDTGVFYEVLSEDRDGVSLFVEGMRKAGYRVESASVPDRFMKNFNTREWSCQDKERYRLFTFAPPKCIHPIITTLE
eukprot:m.114719 g.114719  ORF g.114719 m.114719 type:complete len:349 (+) comp22947_c0_seq4:3-1049(+)